MELHTKRHLRSIAILSGVLAMVSTASLYESGGMKAGISSMQSAWKASIGSSWTFSSLMQKRYPDQPEYRIAQRLQARLRSRGDRAAPEISVLAAAVRTRQDLLSKHIDITFSTDEHPEYTTWSVSAQRYPLWIQPVISLEQATFVMDPEQIARTLEEEQILNLEPPVHAVMRSVTWNERDKDASKGEIEGLAASGYLPDSERISKLVAEGFSGDRDAIGIEIPKEQGRIINLTGEHMGELALWATGRSNYRGSTTARRFNVQKALNEHVHNTVVRPGEMFSFNSTLDGPVSLANGWRMAKVIFNGGDLEPAPGGGICQASTTVFRATVNAGFPVVERRAHSLYVRYYKKHGVGIDATI